MELKDWIILIVPIISNGILITLFQTILNRKIERKNKRQKLRDQTFMLFLEHVQKLNDIFITANADAQQNPNSLSINLSIMQNQVLVIVTYYNTNKFDLDIFSSMFISFINKWQDFINTYKSYSNTSLTKCMQDELGNKLQLAMNENQELINEIRKKY